MNTSMVIQSQLLATKFYVPVAPGTLISRPRLTALLAESLKHPLTLVSAPAGFGKTMLLSAWAQSLPASQALVAWVSLDEEDNDPQLFWTYVLSALDQQDPQRFTPLFKSLQSSSPPSLDYVLMALINLVLDSHEHIVLILDDYHVITEQQIHTKLSYLVEHLSHQLHLILATRVDPPLPLSLLRARGHVVEIRTDQLRCTAQETNLFFKEAMHTCLPDTIIEEVTTRTEGWLVGLQLVGLSLQRHGHPSSLLEEISGNQRYILDYLTEVVLVQQPQEVQTFLLSTCILQRLSASLCDALLQQTNSQRMLKRLEEANLFVVSLDSKRQWYRYHALFAEALYYHLEQTHADLLPVLHQRASLWYAEHNQSTEAILHAFKAHEWQWAADLIERQCLQLLTMTWGANEHQLVTLQQCLEQLPIDVIGSRPQLCLACASMLLMVAPCPILDGWLASAEARLTALLNTQAPEEALQPMHSLQARQEQQDLLGDVMSWHAVLLSLWEDHGQVALSLCQQTLALVSPGNTLARAQVAFAQLHAYYVSSANDAVAAVESGLQASMFAQTAGYTALAISNMGTTVKYMIGAGRLHEALQLTQQAMRLGKSPEGFVSPDVGWPVAFQAEILREWNQLDVAHTLAQEALAMCQQTEAVAMYPYLFYGYALLLRTSLSRGEVEEARFAFQQIERLSKGMNQPFSLHFRSLFTVVDQIRLWLACGERDRATRWLEELDLKERHGTPLTREREEVACVRILLAKAQPALALQRLEPALLRATAGQRWGNVIEMRLLQALAHQMLQQEIKALDAISEAVHLAEPEGYIRSFVDEGAPMQALLSLLREKQRPSGPTPYLDTLLAAFQEQRKGHKRQLKRARPRRRSSL